MKKFTPRTMLLLATLALAAGCATRPDVRHDQDPTADLRAYKTFGFYDHAAADPMSYGSLTGKHLLQAIREQMERQHYVYSEDRPDLRIAAFLVVAERQELQSRGYRAWNSSLDTVNYRQGTLRIDVVDADRNALVWQGVAEGRIDAKAAQNPAATVQAAVGEIFANYPGAKAGQ